MASVGESKEAVNRLQKVPPDEEQRDKGVCVCVRACVIMRVFMLNCTLNLKHNCQAQRQDLKIESDRLKSKIVKIMKTMRTKVFHILFVSTRTTLMIFFFLAS